MKHMNKLVYRKKKTGYSCSHSELKETGSKEAWHSVLQNVDLFNYKWLWSIAVREKALKNSIALFMIIVPQSLWLLILQQHNKNR